LKEIFTVSSSCRERIERAGDAAGPTHPLCGQVEIRVLKVARWNSGDNRPQMDELTFGWDERSLN